MEELRIGVIGCGGIARGVHMSHLDGQVKGAKLVACSDVARSSLQDACDRFGIEGFDDPIKMMSSGLVDAVTVATPHYFHPEQSIAALQRGLHVLTEKPVAVTALAAQSMNEAYEQARASKPELKFAAMFQMRAVPVWKRIKAMIDSGRLGRLHRLLWVGTHWFRTRAYYASASWRATWEGEGGGVLLNQCPHDLDLICWLLGQPERVNAFVSLGRHHAVEVEDDVTAYLEFPGGATGVFICNTGEAPGSSYFELAGEHGLIRYRPQANEFEFLENEVSSTHYLQHSPEGFGKPGLTKNTIQPPESSAPSHRLILQNWVDATRTHEPLIAPATEGIFSVELANAILASGLTGQPIELPMDRPGYEGLLQELIEESQQQRQQAPAEG